MAESRACKRCEAMREALNSIIEEADQANGGKGARLPIVIYMRELAVEALKEAAKLGGEREAGDV